jgi:hypothetical protein
MRLLPVACAAGAVGALALCGCGAARPTAVTGGTLELTLREYRIEPQTVSAPAGRLRIVARNAGILTHNVELERGTLDSAERPVLAVIHTLLPGERDAVVTGPLPPGRYLLVSTVGNQTALGMSATLLVRRPRPRG